MMDGQKGQAKGERAPRRTKLPAGAQPVCRRERVCKPLAMLGLILLGFIFIELANPYGVSSASDQLSRQAFNAILAPWYDAGSGTAGVARGDPAVQNGDNAGSRAPATPQEASIVLLLDDSSLKNSRLTWPLAARQLYFKLQTLAEEHRPAAVFLDVLLTHERPDPRLAPEVRKNLRAQTPRCDFFDTDAAARESKLTLRALANLEPSREPKPERRAIEEAGRGQ
ncbi:MAG: hypothetical protein U5L06_03955 [Rhodovibrio sp.]|nr:hypothetical protein [Rhodovibrio sp.]